MIGNTRTHVLLVDDDPDILQLLEEIIQEGFGEAVEIKTANDPKEARRQLESGVVDLLVTDLEMPGISGLELLRVRSEETPGRRSSW